MKVISTFVIIRLVGKPLAGRRPEPGQDHLMGGLFALEVQGVGLHADPEGLAVGLLGLGGGQLDVIFTHHDAGMAHQVADLVNACAGFSQLGSEGMPKNVDRQIIRVLEVRPMGGFLDPGLEIIGMDGLIGVAGAGKKI